MMIDSRRAVGELGERLAAGHLAHAGFRIIERNFRTQRGELDLVAVDRDCLVFCEVRARVAVANGSRGPATPLESIGPAKRRRLRLMAREWMAAQGSAGRCAPATSSVRFDAVGVTLLPDGSLLALEHLTDAFR